MEVKLYLTKRDLEIVSEALANEVQKCRVRIGRGGTYEEMKQDVQSVETLTEVIEDIEEYISDDCLGLEVSDE